MFRIRCLQQEQLSVRVGVFTWIAALTATLSTGHFWGGGRLGRRFRNGGSLIWVEHNLFVYLATRLLAS